MNDYTVNVGVEVKDGNLNDLQNRLNKISGQNKAINLKIDTADAHKKITQLETRLKKLNTISTGKAGNFKVSVDTSDISRQVNSALNTVNNKFSMKPISVTANTDSAVREFSELNATIKRSGIDVEKFKSTLAGLNFTDKGAADKLAHDLEEVYATITKVDAKFKDEHTFVIDVKGIDQFNREIQTAITMKGKFNEESGTTDWDNSVNHKINLYKQTGNAAKEAADAAKQAAKEEAAAAKQAAAEIKQVGDALNTLGASSEKISSVAVQYEKLENKTKTTVAAMEELYAAQKRFESAYSTYADQGTAESREAFIAEEKKYQSVLQKTRSLVRKNANQEKIRADKLKAETASTNLELEKQKSILRAENWMNANSVVKTQFTDVANEIRSITTAMKACNDDAALDQLNKQLDITIAKAQLAGKTGMNFADKLKMQWSRLSAYFGVSTVIMSGMQGVRKMAQSVLEVDTAMTELKRVTDLTAGQYSDLYDNMTASAKEYGATLEDIINSTADWSRAGFDADTANGLAEITMMYEHIADIDYDEATENLLTAYKGFEGQLTEKFGDDAESAANYIADIFNELDK